MKIFGQRFLQRVPTLPGKGISRLLAMDFAPDILRGERLDGPSAGRQQNEPEVQGELHTSHRQVDACRPIAGHMNAA